MLEGAAQSQSLEVSNWDCGLGDKGVFGHMLHLMILEVFSHPNKYLIEQQSHGMIWVGWVLKDHLVPTPLPGSSEAVPHPWAGNGIQDEHVASLCSKTIH